MLQNGTGTFIISLYSDHNVELLLETDRYSQSAIRGPSAINRHVLVVREEN